GIDTDGLDDALRRPVLSVPPRCTVCCTASMIDRKGLDTLLCGFAHFHSLAGSPDARLVLIGDGHRRPFLESLARDLGIAPSTDFVGHMANPYPPMAAADALRLSSLNEDLPPGP